MQSSNPAPSRRHVATATRLGCRVLWFASLALVLMLAGCDKSDLTEGAYLERGRQAFLNGDIQTSAIEIKNALRLEPQNSEARFLLGQINLAAGNAEAALLEFERAKGLNFNATALMVPMGRAYLLSGRTDDVLQLPLIAEGLTTPDRAYLQSLRGYAFIATREAEKAQLAFETALSLQPTLEFALLGEVRLALTQADLEAARIKIDAALKAAPDSVDVRLLAGEIAALEKDLAAAEAAYSAALVLDPNNVEGLLNRTQLLIARGAIGEAGQDLEVLREVAPNYPKTLYVSGLHHYVAGDHEEALDALEKLITAEPDHDRGLFLLGMTNLALNNDEQGLINLERFVTRNPGSIDGTNQLVIIYLQSGNDARAEQLLNTALRLHPNDLRLFALKALVSVVGGRVNEAVRSLRQAEQLNPEAPGLQLGIGLTLLQAGDATGAAASLDKAIAAGDPAGLAENARVLAYLRAGDPGLALDTAVELVGESPDDPIRHNLVGYIQYRMGQPEKARLAYQASLALVPGEPTASHNLATLARQDGSDDEARQLYEQVLEHYPQNAATLAQLGLLERSLGDSASAVGHLRKALDLDPGSVGSRLALAEHAYATGDVDGAVAVLEAAPPRVKSHPGVLAERAKLYAAAGNLRDAASVLKVLTAQDPTSGSAWLQLGLLQEKLGKRRLAADAFVQAMRNRPAAAAFGVTIARGLHRSGREGDAQALLDDLRERFPNDINVRLLAGWLEYQAGRHEKALNIYLKAHQDAPSRATTMSLAEVYADTKQINEGTSVLRRWLQQNPQDEQASIALAQLQLNAGNAQLAAETLSNLLEHRPDDARLLNDIASLVHPQDPARAVKLARRAHKSAPDSPEIMDTLAVLLLDAGDVAESVQLLTQAVELQPGDPAMRLHLAQALIADGAPQRGRLELEQLLARFPTAQERAAAQRTIEDLLTR